MGIEPKVHLHALVGRTEAEGVGLRGAMGGKEAEKGKQQEEEETNHVGYFIGLILLGDSRGGCRDKDMNFY